MSVPDSYFNSIKNVGAIFDSIRSAGVPAKYTHEFIKQLGFTSSNDRSIIPVLKGLRFLDDNSTPTDRYRRFRDPTLSGAVMAEALRDAYSDLFTVHEQAQDQSSAALTGAFKRITGKGDSVAKKMASTFKALSELADWSASPLVSKDGDEVLEEGSADPRADQEVDIPPVGFPTLHHDIHIHLPASTEVKVYDAIFRSLREHLT
jgi:hypothetical protein